MTQPPSRLYDSSVVAEHYASGDWDARTVADHVRRNVAENPDGWAFRAPDSDVTWRAYDVWSTRLAAALRAAGLNKGDFLAVLLTGGSLVHITYLAAQKAGLVTVGLGPRSGDKEIAEVLKRTEAVWLLTRSQHRGRPADEVASAARLRGGNVDHLVTVDLDGAGIHLAIDGQGRMLPTLDDAASLDGENLTTNELYFINHTSGTTGLPKCVMATMNNKKYFSNFAIEAGRLTADDIFCSVLPAPYGFGLWSAHFVPTMLGATTVLSEEFNPEDTLALIEKYDVTVLAAVTSQFIMMLNAPEMASRDLSSLRVVFTGGERVQRTRAEEFESRTGATILQFYGSNEAGPLSVTRIGDTLDKRLATVGRPIAGQHVRLYETDGADVTAVGGPGQIGGRGPGTAPGYYRDETANQALFREDGWQLTGDIGRIDDEGYLVLAGRTADFIIRGGQNISALEVETDVSSHPRIAQVAAVGVPDPVLGERVWVAVVTRDGAPITLEDIAGHLAQRGVSKHYWPEGIRHLEELPLSAGGKTDKRRLKDELLAAISPDGSS